MKIVCISASNMKSSGEDSTSLKLSKIIQEKCFRINESFNFTIIDLRQFELNPCIGCGKCYNNEYKCTFDEQYNSICKKLINADVLFIVSPHYAPIPSKLSMLLEKLEQNTFLKRFNDQSYRSPLYNKPLGIIGHGGGTKELADWYKGVIIESIVNALSFPIEMKNIDYDEKNKNGIIISVDKVTKREGTIFPKQEYDWKSIKKIIEEYTEKVVLN